MNSLANFETILNFNYLLNFSFEDVTNKEILVVDGSINYTDSILFFKPLWTHLTIKSKEYKGRLILNFTKEFLIDLIEKEDVDLGFDAVGEVLNTMAGVMAEQNDIIEVFGEFIQEPPQNSETPMHLPIADIISGQAKFLNHKINFALVIESNK